MIPTARRPSQIRTLPSVLLLSLLRKARPQNDSRSFTTGNDPVRVSRGTSTQSIIFVFRTLSLVAVA
jgi:hypothetical protein